MKEIQAFREAEIKAAMEANPMYAADMDRESKKKTTIAAELERKELEAELGSARALAMLEQENKRRQEELQYEQEKLYSETSVVTMKRKVRDLIWDRCLMLASRAAEAEKEIMMEAEVGPSDAELIPTSLGDRSSPLKITPKTALMSKRKVVPKMYSSLPIFVIDN